MRYKLLCCKILEREVARISCNCKNVIDVTMLRQKLHDRPSHLMQVLQEEIDMIEQGSHRYSNHTELSDYDAILLGYGLCSEAVVGLHSHKYMLVIPRVHDCVTLLMGDRKKYIEYYRKNAGTFYYWADCLELMGLAKDSRYEARYYWYLNRYHGNEKKAKKALEKERMLLDSYQKAAYISWPELSFPEYAKEVQQYASHRGWNYEEIEGSARYLCDLLNGNWDEERFLVIPPGETAEPSYDERVLKLAEK